MQLFSFISAYATLLLLVTSASATLIDEKLVTAPIRSIMRPGLFEHDGVSQGHLGSCHIFSTQALLKDATGVSVSVAHMFLDHLLNVGGSNLAIHTTGNTIHEINVNHVLSERTKTAAEHCESGFFDWEAGSIRKDLLMLQRVGGVIVPDNTDYKDIEALMDKLNQERLTMIRKDRFFLRSSKTKLTESGLAEIVERANDPKHNGRIVADDRELVKSIAQMYTVRYVDFDEISEATADNIRKRIDKLVKRLETNAIVLAVDIERYSSVVFEGKHLSVDAFPTNSQHFVIVAGYEISDDTFFIRDSNFKRVIAVNAQDIVLSTEWAGYYSKI